MGGNTAAEGALYIFTFLSQALRREVVTYDRLDESNKERE